ncbi:flagellar motor protein MotB [Opitutaceae bacterium EW11]|nr:flagellar motor protein MotB [Opitutaceae bacterium EW11]
MNHLSKKLCIVLVSAMVAFAGCTKKPKRPAPSDTVLGQGGAQSGLNVGGPESLGDASATGLAQREGVIEDENTIRGLLQPVYFDYDKSAIKEGERAKLQDAKAYLEKNPQYRLLLEGRCDWRGTAEYNMGLGDRRANAAKKYLQTLGVAPAKLETISKGDLEAKENGSDDEMAKDRRVDVVVLKK